MFVENSSHWARSDRPTLARQVMLRLHEVEAGEFAGLHRHGRRRAPHRSGGFDDLRIVLVNLPNGFPQ
jgi:hypothetical protein